MCGACDFFSSILMTITNKAFNLTFGNSVSLKAKEKR